MLQVKLFRFLVNNWTSNAHSNYAGTPQYKKDINKVYSTDRMEEIINSFCKNHDVISIAVNKIECKYHNNSCGNTIDLIYTIAYKAEDIPE